MIRLRIEGRMLERLLARAMEQGAAFHRVARDGERALTLDTDARGARVVRALCERHSLPVGKKDHATVLHACKTIKDQMETSKSFRSSVEEIEVKLRS